LINIICCLRANAQVPEWLWAKDAAGNNRGYNLCTDGNGNVYTIGTFTDLTVSFDTFTLTNTNGNAGKSDLFIVKYDSWGNVQWAKNFGCNYNTLGHGISSDANDNIFVTGIFNGSTLTFDTTVLTNTYFGDFSLFVVKLDTYGNIIWAKTAKGLGRGIGVSATTLGSLYVTGVCANQIIFDSDTLTGGNVFIVKYDSSGNVLWARNSQNKRWAWGQYVTTDIYENAIITGSFMTDTVVFGNDTIIGDTTDYHLLVVKYDKLGNEMWAKSAGPETFIYPGGKYITSDVSGNIILTGSFGRDSITFDGYTLTNMNVNVNGGSDVYIVKYDSVGNVLWAKREGGTFVDLGQTVSSDEQGNIFMTATSRSDTIIIGNDTLINNGGVCFSGNCFNIIVVKYDSSGNIIWTTKPEGSNNGAIGGSALDATSNLFITGLYQNNLIFGNITLLTTGTGEYYVAKLEDLNTLIIENTGSKIKIFPIPFDDMLNVQVNENGLFEFILFDITGRKILKEIFTKSITIDTKHLAEGIYIYQIHSGNETSAKGKVIKQ